jgi:outer membrane protein assembly factor BamE
MKKIIPLTLFCVLLASCSFVHKMDINQGNIYTQAEVSRLHSGMSTSEVKNILGTPVMVNVLSDNRLDYVYTNQPGHEEMTEKRLTCFFKNDRLVRIEQN